jgi:hypothetical protein
LFIRQGLETGVIFTWQVVHPEEGGLLLAVVWVPCHEDVISSFLESREIAKRMAYSKDRYKIEAGIPGFSPGFFGLFVCFGNGV